MAEVIKVGIADMNICKVPDTITTVGLGSCVGVVLYDERKKISGLLHVMLPDSTRIKDNSNKAKFADTGIDFLIKELQELGVHSTSLKAKIAGGAKMFSFASESNLGNIGDNNVKAVKAMLTKKNIPIIAEDTGENYGRTIVFNPDDFTLLIKRAGNKSIII